jgi:hypothetical protein
VDIDGHDYGSGQGNISLFTDNPNDTFLRIQEIVDKSQIVGMRAAIRDLNDESEKFTILWPNDLAFF